MKILAIGDPHLGGLEKMVQRFHYPTDYFEQVAKNVAAETPQADLLLIAGDLVWGKEFSDAMESLNSIQTLKARNICFIEGNHDHWVPEYSKMYELYNTPAFYFLSGRSFIFDNIGVCGACGTDRDSSRKGREAHLLQNSLNALSRADIELGICMMHYPPSSQIFKNPEESFAEDHFFSLIEESGIIDKVVYGHLHEDMNIKINLQLKIDNIELYCTSIDYFNWHPVDIL